MKLAALAALAMSIGACEQPSNNIVLWHAYNGAERDALAASAATWNAAHPDRQVELVAVPYNAFADKLTSAIPGGNGPDLFIYSQDRIGDWAASGAIEPIEFYVDDARADRFADAGLETMTYKGSIYGLPLASKSLVLYYRTDLVTAPPTTTDAIVALAPAMTAKHGFALAYANGDLYGHAPWLHGFGGTVMSDDGTLHIASPEAARAMSFARQLVIDKVVPDHAEGPQVASLFNEGLAATVISGPWFISDIGPNVPYAVTTLPTVSPTGELAEPFASAEGILMSARAKDKDAAFAVMDALTGDVAALERARRARQVVPNKAIWSDPAVVADATLGAFRAQLAHSVPLPKTPAMRTVWTPYETALGEVLTGHATPAERLLALEKEVAGYTHVERP